MGLGLSFYPFKWLLGGGKGASGGPGSALSRWRCHLHCALSLSLLLSPVAVALLGFLPLVSKPKALLGLLPPRDLPCAQTGEWGLGGWGRVEEAQQACVCTHTHGHPCFSLQKKLPHGSVHHDGREFQGVGPRFQHGVSMDRAFSPHLRCRGGIWAGRESRSERAPTVEG